MNSPYPSTLHDISKETNVPYNFLICMLYELNCKTQSEAYFYNQLDVPYLPMEVMTLLWPEDTSLEVEKLFWQVYDRVENMEEGGITYYDHTMIVWPYAYPLQNSISWPGFTNSWLYKTMLEWVDDQKITLKDRAKAKKAMFDVVISKTSSWLD